MPTHRVVQADNLPTPAGPYSPATIFDRLVFVSGHGARVAAGIRLDSLDIEAQTEHWRFVSNHQRDDHVVRR